MAFLSLTILPIGISIYVNVVYVTRAKPEIQPRNPGHPPHQETHRNIMEMVKLRSELDNEKVVLCWRL
jgi:hypothetical protein